MDPLVAALDRLVIGSVAVTERAIAAAGTDLTFVQWRVLMIVGEHDRGATVGEIAERIGARSSPASRLIARLGARGVVATTRDTDDARVTRVRLTDSGLELRRRVLDARHESLAIIAATLRISPPAVRGIELMARALETYS
jgi:DNA-binding MarR family transcriptional regulator